MKFYKIAMSILLIGLLIKLVGCESSKSFDSLHNESFLVHCFVHEEKQVFFIDYKDRVQKYGNQLK